MLLCTAEVPALAQGPLRLVSVSLRDARTSAPISGALIGVNRGAPLRSDSVGVAAFTVRSDSVWLDVRALGYTRWQGYRSAADASLRIALEPAATLLQTVEVRSRALGTGSAFQSAAVIGSEQLAERMAPSIAAVIAAEPGVNVRTNGPMASAPVIRGLTGDRVLVLEDGMRTGDIATTAPDHAVTVDPATARRIEVIRGPAGLLYGSNTLGGVVNVVRDDIPRERIDAMHWDVSSFGEQVNRGVGGAARVNGGHGALAWSLDGTGRQAADTRGPNNVALPFTDLEGFDAGAGLAVVGDRGHAGVSAREYRSYYGVPSSFGGVTLPGAHDGGVYVDIRRSAARADAEWRSARGVVEAVSMGANGVRFEQSEFEQGGFVGTRFGQLAASGEAVVRLRSGGHRGAIGAYTQWRDLRAQGSFTGTRPAVQRTLAAFAVDEYTRGRVTLLAGARIDRITTRPLDSTESLLLRNVRSRAFSAVTGAVGARVQLTTALSATVQAARAFRPPSIEELYSAGPHLASYAYEIGDPGLEAERGTGTDAVLRWQGMRGRVELAAYTMQVRDYVAFAPQVDSSTGLPLRDPRLRRYVVYRPTQVDARLSGAELRAVFAPSPQWLLDLGADLPRGRQLDGTHLPAMPAATTRLDVRHVRRALTLGLTADARYAQNRVPSPPVQETVSCDVVVRDGEASALPAEFCATPGVLLVHALVTWRVPTAARLRWPTTLTMTVDNLFDRTWRDPMWRAKQVAPQPGRNVRLMLQVAR
jgi:iron complex outermembrane recepter protein